jgi:type I restriction enzyme, S subunit
MEVRPGFKPTEVGVIPEDWDAESLGKLFTFSNGVNAGKAAYGHGLRFVNVLEPITHSHLYGPEIPGRVSLPDSVAAAYAVKTGDVLFNRTSETDADLGLAATYLGTEHVVFGGFVIRGRPTGERLDPTYSGYALRAPAIRSQIIRMGQGAIRANLGQQNLKLVVAPVPPKSEQRAVATALSDMDALLGGLDRLIAKKRDLKQAAMQQLLTGQTRLPGFSGAWKRINMARNSRLNARIGWQGLTTAEYLVRGTYYLVTGTDFSSGRVNWVTCPFVAADRYEQDRNIQLSPKDVLVTKDGTIGKVAFVGELPGPATLNSGVFVVRPKDAAYESTFLYHILSSAVFDDFLTKLAAGSTISHLYQKDFVSFTFLAPPTLAEQSAIANVLDDMDSELAVLEARRSKTRDLKRAMMQELLTGKTRLVHSETVNV